jgi:murein DD-endopeptidase MepM/ murein hydrolase activator NlpD
MDLRGTLLTDVKRLPLHRAICLILIATLLPASAAASGTTLEQRIAAQRARAAQLQMRLHAKRVELGEATLRYQDLQQQLNQTNAAIGEVNGRIDSLAAQQASTQRRIAWNAIQLDAARRSLLLHDELLKRRLVDIYEYGDLTYVDALIAARSFSEFVERWEDLRLLIAANQRAVRARKAAEARVAAVEADLEGTRLQLQQEEQAQDEARSQLGSLADERRNLVTLAGTRRRTVATQVAEMEDLSAAEEASLEGLILERERELESQQRAAGIAGGGDRSGSVGMFSWPVTGTITSPFGWRSNPFGGSPEFHQGLDIAAPTGTTVTAAAGGTVIMAQWYGGYGNYILIDHGGGYSTGYGHLSAIYVSTGQSVQRGQAIGAVGSTGQSTGPHLHFEVRIAGKPVDPAPRLH